MTNLEVLKAARDLISTPEKWTRGTCARDAQNRPTSPSDPEACCWCAFGALVKAAGFTRACDELLIAAAGLPKGRGIGVFNDAPNITHADVLALFDRAIAAEESR